MDWKRIAVIGTGLLVIYLGWPSLAHSQGYDPSRRGIFGAALQVGVPRGEFDDYVDPAPGLNGFFVYNLDRGGNLGLRLDGSYLLYGSETTRRPLSRTISRVDVDVSTRNQIFSLFLGPQLTGHLGALKPYATAGIGFSYFVTESGISDVDDFLGDEIVSSTNFDDITFAWTGGGGLLVRVSRKVHIDLGARFVQNGEVRYLREGSIRETSNGAVFFTPIESESDLLVFQIGVGLSFRGWGAGGR